jgi:hypothetical protein
MDEHWHLRVEGAWLHVDNSWTGVRAMSVRFESSIGGWRIAEALAAGDHRQFLVSPPGRLTSWIEALISERLLKRAAPVAWRALRQPLPPLAPGLRWAEPGWVLVGGHPGTTEQGAAVEALAILKGNGIRHVVDLTAEMDRDVRGNLLDGYNEAANRSDLSLRRYPLSTEGIPELDDPRAILDEIAQALAAGRPTYIHEAGGSDRSLLVGGAWMLASGIANNDRVVSRLLARERPESTAVTIEREDYRRYLSTTADFEP